jgi:hypothetical protein
VTKGRKASSGDGLVKKGETDRLDVEMREGEPVGRTLARVALSPLARHASIARTFAFEALGDGHRPNLMATMTALEEDVVRASGGDLTLASRILASQAVSLDTLFTEMARRSALNMGDYPDAMERYMRLALKAQANCRATLEALAKLHQPREQIVKHVHVNQGAKAVVADQIHHHTGGRENGKSDKQSDATGETGQCAALPCPDPLGNGVPVSRPEGEAAMQDAWRDKPWRA